MLLQLDFHISFIDCHSSKHKTGSMRTNDITFLEDQVLKKKHWLVVRVVVTISRACMCVYMYQPCCTCLATCVLANTRAYVYFVMRTFEGYRTRCAGPSPSRIKVRKRAVGWGWTATSDQHNHEHPRYIACRLTYTCICTCHVCYQPWPNEYIM